jgi:hypothetical protein
VHERQGNSVVARHGDGRDRLAAARDLGRVGLIVEAESGNNADVAYRR